MERFVEFSQYAKVNLSLDVLGEENGFHELDMVMASVSLSDHIEMRLRDDDKVTVTYSTGESYKKDNALRSARLIRERYSLPGVDITISKGVPEGVGLGGSAVDSAGIARGYEMLTGISLKNDFLLTLGGDVPFLKQVSPAIVKGRGQLVTPVTLKDLSIALVYGDKPLSTKAVFETYDRVGGEGISSKEFLSSYSPLNALERPALLVEPNLKDSKALLELAGFEKVVMTGAGAGFIAFEENEEKFNLLYQKANEILPQHLTLKRLTLIKD